MSGKALRETVDCSNAINRGSITLLDIRNSVMYGRYLWNKTRCDALAKASPGDFQWTNRYTTGETSYFCPVGLTGCYEGTCLITSENECLKHSFYPYEVNSEGAKITPGGTGPQELYLEFRQDKNYPQAGNNCYFGNKILRRWCTSPGSRNPSSSSPPFFYNMENGNCYITEDFCKNEGLQHSDNNVPLFNEMSDANKEANPDFKDSQYPFSGIGGDCYEPEGQEIFGAIFGQTLTRIWTSNCLSKLSDRNTKKTTKILHKNFGGEGIHLYMFSYKPEYLRLHPEYKRLNLGFMADEIKKVYPELVKRKKGLDYIEITKDQCKDKKYWRIANMLLHEKQILKIYLDKINEYTNYK